MLILSTSIIILLLFATFIVSYKIKKSPTPELLNNKKRIKTWWIIAFVCFFVLYSGNWAIEVLILALAFWATYELLQLRDIRFSLSILLVLIAATLLYRSFSPSIALFLLPTVFLALFYILSERAKISSLFLVVFSVTAIESIILISHLSVEAGIDNRLVILYLFFVTAFNDISQYLLGSFWGRTPLAPRISPNKTLEGALGGIVATGLFVGVSLDSLFETGFVSALLVGVFVACLGIVGDLSFSFFKRRAKVKDSGTSLPGHGGLMDRIDSLTLTAPGFGLCITFLG